MRRVNLKKSVRFFTTGTKVAGLDVVISLDGKRIVMGKVRFVSEHPFGFEEEHWMVKLDLLQEMDNLIKEGYFPCGIAVHTSVTHLAISHIYVSSTLQLFKFIYSTKNLGYL